MTDEENLPELPEGWVWTKLIDIGQIASGGTPSTKDDTNFNGDIPWLTPADLSGYKGKYITNGRRNISTKGLSNSSAKLIPSGSILYSSRAPIGYIVIAKNPISTNQGFKNLILGDHIFNEYVYYYLKGNKDLAESYASGTTFKELSGKRFSSIPIPLPPLPEQHRIVAKIETLFTRLDAGVSALTTLKTQLKRYRQAVLKSAMEGKLTAKWREEHKGKLEPARELLERIKAERKKEGTKGKSRRRKELPPVDKSELPVLPEGWGWTYINDISSSYGGYAFSSKLFKEKGKFQVVKIANVKMGKLLLESRPSYIDDVSDNIIDKYFLHRGDCIITLTGTRKKRDYGFIVMITNQRNLLLNQRVALIRFSKLLLCDFFQYALQTEHFQNNFFTHETGNVGQGNVSLNALITGTLPIPPFKEQQQIFSEIENRFSVIDYLENIIAQSLTRAERLRQSILKRAFEGKLVPQDPTDEPASKLLERIKAEKAKMDSKSKSKRRRRS